MDLANISSRSLVTGLALPAYFFNSLILSEYLSVFKVCSHELTAGEILAIIVVLLFPVKLSFKT